MQNWTGCAELEQDDGSNGDRISITLTDKRDGNTYTVAKLKDGKCWMTQNLVLGRDESISLNENDSDLVGVFYIPKSENQPRTYNDGPYIYYNSNQEADRVYYNWYAATAGTGILAQANIATYSICPKSFHLPHPDEFVALFKLYSSSELFQQPNYYKGYGGIRSSDNFEVGYAEYWTKGLRDANNPSRTLVGTGYYYSNTGVVTWGSVGGGANGPASYSVRCISR